MLESNISDIDAHIGKQIRSRRHFLGLSQTDLANKIGVTFQQIQKYEKGQNKITAGRLLEASHILNVNINYFFKNFSNRSSDLKLHEEPAEFSYKQPPEEQSKPDAIKLVKLYNKIPNNKIRKNLLNFLKSITNEDE